MKLYNLINEQEDNEVDIEKLRSYTKEVLDKIKFWMEHSLSNKKLKDDYGNEFKIFDAVATKSTDFSNGINIHLLTVYYYFYGNQIPDTLLYSPFKQFIDELNNYAQSENIDLSNIRISLDMWPNRIKFTFRDCIDQSVRDIEPYLAPYYKEHRKIQDIRKPESDLNFSKYAEPSNLPTITYAPFENQERQKVKVKKIFNTLYKGTFTVDDYKMEYELSHPTVIYTPRFDFKMNKIELNELHPIVKCFLKVPSFPFEEYSYYGPKISEILRPKIAKQFGQFKILLLIDSSIQHKHNLKLERI